MFSQHWFGDNSDMCDSWVGFVRIGASWIGDSWIGASVHIDSWFGDSWLGVSRFG